MVYTTVSEFALGEMLYGLSLEADGLHSFAGYAVNPIRLYTELLTGSKPAGSMRNIYELLFKSALGTTNTYTSFSDTFESSSELFPVFVMPELAIVYNDPYGLDFNIPYNQFEMPLGGSFGSGSGKGRSSIGGEAVFKWKWIGAKGHSFDSDFHLYAMYAFDSQKQTNTSTGWELVGLGSLSYEFPVSDTVNIGLGNTIYIKKALYDDVPVVFQAVDSTSVYARFKLKQPY